MAARRDSGLREEQVEQLRTDLAAGRRPRVRVSASQLPAGTTGAVLRVGDPAADGPDYLTVRIKVGGVTDELGFSPEELSLPARGRTIRADPSDAKPAPGSATPPRRTAQARKRPEKVPAAKAAAGSGRPAAGGEGTTQPVARAAVTPPRTSTRPKQARSGRRPAGVPAVTVTIASEGAAWSVTAKQGARAVVKKAAVPPGVIAAVAVLLGQPGIVDAVAAVNDTARVEAEARAERLRAELAEVEAVLNSHRRP
jgi:hypothetical protein